MTYITKFSNVQITGDLTTTGNIAITGNVSANSELLTSNINIGNVTIDGSTSNANIIGSSNLTIGANIMTLGASLLSLGEVSNLEILGNVPAANGAAIYLSSDGNGHLSWGIPQGTGTGVVGGGTNSIQYNNGNGFGGDVANFAYVANLDGTGIPQLSINAPTVFGGNANGGVNAANVNVALDIANLTIQGGSGLQILYTSGGGNVYFGNTPTGSPVGPNNAVQLNGGGNLLNGYANFSYNDDNLQTLTLGGLDIAGSTGVVSLTTAPSLTLPTVADVKIPGGSNNFVMKTDGAGNLSFEVSTYYNVSTISDSTPFVPNTHVDDMICVPFAGDVSITLPAASDANVGAYFIIKDTWGGNRQANPITLSVNGGALIDGQSTVQITGAYNSITVSCTSNTAWGVI